jgi:Ser-tRNA(Ala) deacylase AlaX
MTELKYMDNQFLYTDETEVVLVDERDGQKVVVVNSTILYPQGGGSPYDQGYISNENGKFRVEEVRFDYESGDVFHIGNFESGEFKSGEKVTLEVDQERRILNAKLQSAGHLIDMAMRDIGRADMTPDKGFHFPEGPSVEYKGTVDAEQFENLKQQLQNSLDQMIETGYEVDCQTVGEEKAREMCYLLPSKLPENKPIRVVSVWNDEYMPCGAIHVANISELKGLRITKLKNKKGNLRVGYEIV